MLACLLQCVCISYIFALARLLKAGKQPKRTVYMTFCPDEEIGGTRCPLSCSCLLVCVI